MAQEEDFEPDDILREIGFDYSDDEEVEPETAEELDFENGRIQGYEDVIIDLDQREKALDVEEPEAEPTD